MAGITGHLLLIDGWLFPRIGTMICFFCFVHYSLLFLRSIYMIESLLPFDPVFPVCFSFPIVSRTATSSDLVLCFLASSSAPPYIEGTPSEDVLIWRFDARNNRWLSCQSYSLFVFSCCASLYLVTNDDGIDLRRWIARVVLLTLFSSRCFSLEQGRRDRCASSLRWE